MMEPRSIQCGVWKEEFVEEKCFKRDISFVFNQEIQMKFKKMAFNKKKSKFNKVENEREKGG